MASFPYRRTPVGKGRAMSEHFELLPHVCRHCAGRLLRRVDAAGPAIRCADCGHTVPGIDPTAVCFCGALPANFRTRIRCAPNDAKSPESPSEVVAIEVER
jgi:hypothetical protein